MYKSLFFAFLLISVASFGQKGNRYDSTVKIGKAGYRVTCMNRNLDRNSLNIRPIGFKSEVREANLELKGRVVSTEIDDLNNDGFPDIIILVMEAKDKLSLFSIASRENERMEPIYFPDITNDMQLSKGYRGMDEYKLVEGVLFRKFPIFESDTTIKTPTNKVRQIMYRVVTGEQGSWQFKSFKTFEMAAN